MKIFKRNISSLIILLCAMILPVADAAQAQTTFSNGNPITISDFSPASPYPSNIRVSGLTGSVTKVTATISNFNHPFPADVGVLLVSPTGATVNLLSRCPSNAATNINLTFDDSAPNQVPIPFASGTYRPRQCNPVTYSAPAPSPPYGTAMSAFNNTTPNGVWKLYVQDFASGSAGSIANGWSLTITTASSPGTDLTATKTHPRIFNPGQTGAQYTITVMNFGSSPSSGTVTVTDTLPAGLTATAIGGTGWNCTLATLTCTRSDALAGGSNYPAITLTVNVASNAPSSVTNTATVSGGGDASANNNTASDPTMIAPSDLTVSKSHNFNFQQGQTGAQYTISVSNFSDAPTSGTVTVTDALPTGLTATAISGTGWNCILATLTCTRSDVLEGQRTYPQITLTVNVASNAPPSVTNTATVSGGGEADTSNNTATDPTTVTACSNGDVVVTTNADGGAGSLRQAIADVCHNHTITFSASVTSPITLNSALGPLFLNKSLTINGPGASVLTISGNNQIQVFSIPGNAGANTVTISGLKIANGETSTEGGGIQSRNTGTVNIINSVVSNNHAGNFGGGISNTFGTLNVINSTVSGNSVSGNAALGNGGGINNQGGTLNVSGSTFSGNTADYGGGIHNERRTTTNVVGTLNIVNSTFSGNAADVDGGAIYNFSGSTINLINGTISANNAGENGGGVVNDTGSITVKNTIIAGNSALVADDDVFGAFVSQGYNLIGKLGTAGGFTNNTNNDQVGTSNVPVNPMLGALANNGGPTQTMALQSGSPAIDKGSAATNPIASQPVTTDQRGLSRPFDNPSINNAPGGNGSDIGAFEAQNTPTAASVTVSGRLLTAHGRGISNALVRLTEADGTTRTVSTGAFGYYRFADVSAGQTVILEVFSKRFNFANSVRVINVGEETADADFISSP